MKKALVWINWVVAIAFAIQSLVISSAMITKTLTVPFLITGLTVAAGWITLVLVILAIVVTLFRTLSN